MSRATKEFWNAAFSSKYDDIESPKWLIDKLSSHFIWNLDTCATKANVCDRYLSKDSLITEWSGLCWMNPPYGNQIGRWIKKARVSINAITVCLVPARTDTKWWQENIPYASVVVFIRGRLRFERQKYNAPFPSAFVVFGELQENQIELLSSFGIAMRSFNGI